MKSGGLFKTMRTAAAIAALAVAAASGVAAQTLVNPNSVKRQAPTAAARPAAARMNVCSQYGAGFVYVPSSGACIKIGGYVDGAMGTSH